MNGTQFHKLSFVLRAVGALRHPQFLADQLTLSQPRGADYAHQIILAPPNFLGYFFCPKNEKEYNLKKINSMEGLVRYFFYIEIPINAESHMYKVTTMYSQLSNKQVCWNKRVGLNFSSNLINE